jgi:hypothetical protein
MATTLLAWLAIALTVSLGALDAASTSGPDRKTTDGVAVSNEHGPCPAIMERSPRHVTGGCKLDALGSGISMKVHSMVGDFDFSSCTVNFDLRLDRHGRALMEHFNILGRSPCNDARPCFTETAYLPIHGRVRAVGPKGLVLAADMCLDTCLGRFRGGFVFAIARSGNAWRLNAERAPIGDSGWEIDGGWDLETPSALEIRRMPA